MKMEKIIAKEELNILGGEPKVIRYWDESETRKIDILHCENVPQNGIQSCGTIGLAKTDIGLVVGNKNLRVEILGACNIKEDRFCNIVSSAAFHIICTKKCFPGYIINDVIKQYVEDTEMKHVFLTDPFLWEKAKSFTIDSNTIAWLMIIPISDNELVYARKNGVEKLEDLFEKKDIDIFDLHRKTIIYDEMI